MDRPITSKDRQTFRRYARRIREVVFTSASHESHGIDESVVRFLCETFPAPLLPNLRRIICLPRPTPTRHEVSLHVNPPLAGAHIGDSDIGSDLCEDPALGFLMASLVKSTPELREFHVGEWNIEYSIITRPDASAETQKSALTPSNTGYRLGRVPGPVRHAKSHNPWRRIGRRLRLIARRNHSRTTIVGDSGYRGKYVVGYARAPVSHGGEADLSILRMLGGRGWRHWRTQVYLRLYLAIPQPRSALHAFHGLRESPAR